MFTIFAGVVSGDYSELETIFKLPEGDWDPVMKVTDLSGRLTKQPLTPVGGGAAVVIGVRPAGYNVVANPVITEITPAPNNTANYSLACSTPGATIFYQVKSIGSAPGESWTTCPGGTLNVGRPHGFTPTPPPGA